MQGGAGSFEFLMRGGFMMIPLLLSGLVALTVVIERVFVMRFRLTSPQQLASEVVANVRKGNWGSATERVDKLNTPVAAVLAAGLRDTTAPLDEVELTMQNQAEAWMPILEKRLEILDTIITAAPLMGLLGTITGMMASFRVLSEKGVNEPNAITGGVAEALIATATGLVIALLCLLAYNYFNHKVKNFIYEMEAAAAQLLETRKVLARVGSTSPEATRR